jgi:hypothetical protein
MGHHGPSTHDEFEQTLRQLVGRTITSVACFEIM